MMETRNAYKIVVGKPVANRTLGRRNHRHEDIIKMDLRKYDVDKTVLCQTPVPTFCYEPSGWIEEVTSRAGTFIMLPSL
jgi:hypothetical protein